jgi:tRNA-specific 2-thiouridylase
MEKIIIAMSGGVDSSVAAWLLKDYGYDVIGVSLRLVSEENMYSKRMVSTCCSLDDMNDARQVCEKINIPFYAVDVRDRFNKTVIKPFIHSYLNGQTPNPCIRCNQYIKFTELLNIAQSLNAKLSSGHYATISNYYGLKTIKRSRDINKDQTYYLYNISSKILNILDFPLGRFRKDEIRKIAKKIGLRIFDKPDSQEICFIGDSKYSSLIKENLKQNFFGDLVDIQGKKIGSHNGIYNYTVGQRKGIGIAFGYKAYVVSINSKNNEVMVGSKKDLHCKSLSVIDLNQIIPIKFWPSKILVQIRSKNITYRACWELLNDNKLKIIFFELVISISLGQAAVFYDVNYLLGGGTVSNIN